MKRAKFRGFTLLEIIVSLGLFSMMMVLVGLILQRGEAQTHLSDNRIVLQDNLRESLYQMGQEVRQTSPSRISIVSGGTGFSFQIPSGVNNSGVISWSSPILYQVGGNGRQLIRTDTGSGRTRVLANDVQSVTFTANGSPVATVNYSVTAQRTLNNGRTISLTSAGEARLRNV